MTEELTITNERIDDIPILMAQMEKMQVAELLDKHFPTNGNWSGLSLGTVTSVWLAFILSESNHRLSHVRPWVEQHQTMIETCLGQKLRGLDFTDDRLAAVLDYLSDATKWASFEDDLNSSMIRVYDLKPERTRIDSTTAKSYGKVIAGGLIQFGHSKDHRPDLGQIKINLSVLDPLGLPLTTTILSGERADDPLYVPEIKRIQETLGRRGLTHIGDSKMAAFATRVYVSSSGDFYLCPLPGTQMPDAEIMKLIEPVRDKSQKLTVVYRKADATSKPESVAEGYEYSLEMRAQVDEETISWTERRLVIRSMKLAQSQERGLQTRVARAVEELTALNERRQGKKVLREETEARKVVEEILAKHRVEGLIEVTYGIEITRQSVRAYGSREASEREYRRMTITATAQEGAVNQAIERLGWRVYATNASVEELSLKEAVFAYRTQYLVERGFGRLKGKPLSLTPVFLDSDDRVTGLIRVLTIGLRALTLLEFNARRVLREESTTLSGIYPGNPTRATDRPTTEMMLRTFKGLTVTFVTQAGITTAHLTPLNRVHHRILELFGFSPDVYLRLGMHSSEPPLNLSEP